MFSIDFYKNSYLSTQGGAKEHVASYDTIWSKSYDEDMKQMGYGGPTELLNLVEKYLPDKEAKIIDIVAGTGNLGMKLKLAGYENLDALDGSEEMLKFAKEKGIYKNYHCQLLEPNTPVDLPQHSYDAAVGSGCFAPAHLNSDHFMILPNLVKKSGKVIFGVNRMFFKDDLQFAKVAKDWDYDLEGRLKEMENDGIWKRLECVDVDGYFKDVVGRYFVFEVL